MSVYPKFAIEENKDWDSIPEDLGLHLIHELNCNVLAKMSPKARTALELGVNLDDPYMDEYWSVYDELYPS